jgi:hypothetical protein
MKQFLVNSFIFIYIVLNNILKILFFNFNEKDYIDEKYIDEKYIDEKYIDDVDDNNVDEEEENDVEDDNFEENEQEDSFEEDVEEEDNVEEDDVEEDDVEENEEEENEEEDEEEDDDEEDDVEEDDVEEDDVEEDDVEEDDVEEDDEEEEDEDDDEDDDEEDNIDVKSVDIIPKVHIKEYYRKEGSEWHKVLIEEDIDEFIKMYKDIEHKNIVVDYVYSHRHYKLPVKSDDDLKYLQELDGDINKKNITWCMIETEIRNVDIEKYLGPRGDFYETLNINIRDLHLDNLEIGEDTEIAIMDGDGNYHVFDRENPTLTFKNPRLVNEKVINETIKSFNVKLTFLEKVRFLSIYYCDETIKYFYKPMIIIFNILKNLAKETWNYIDEFATPYINTIYPDYCNNNSCDENNNEESDDENMKLVKRRCFIMDDN